MSVCPYCRQLIPERGDLLHERITELERACHDRGYAVLPGGRVREDAAAELLGLAPGTLRNWSYQHRPLPFMRVARRRTYYLRDVAAFMLRDE